MYLFLTSQLFVVLAGCIPVMGNDLRNCQGRGIIAVLHLCQTVREDMAIGDILMVVSCSTALLHCISASRHSDRTPDSRRLPLCVRDYRSFRSVEATLQTATAVVSSHYLIRCGNLENSYCFSLVDTRSSISSVRMRLHLVCAFFV